MKTNSKNLENQLAKTKAAQAGEELRAFAEESSIELPQDILETVSGGMEEVKAHYITRCRKCGSTNIEKWLANPSEGMYGHAVRCKDCGWMIY